jgi:RNA polymerase sigma factor FliA
VVLGVQFCTDGAHVNAPDSGGLIVGAIEVLTVNDPLFRLQNQGIRARLTAAILSLAESERLIFMLYYYEGLTTEEIALLLDETASSVAQLHASALLCLRARLARPESEFSESNH